MIKKTVLAGAFFAAVSAFGSEIVLQNGTNGYSGTTDVNLWYVNCTDATASIILNEVAGGYTPEYNSQPNGQALILYNLAC